ncbi:MAG: acyl carrier protein [Deltaproteobacteria bacterium]
MSDYAEKEQKVKAVLADKLNMDINKISLDSHLFDDLGMDSFGSIEIVFELEEKFGIKILETDIEKAKTVKDIVDYIVTRTAADPTRRVDPEAFEK